MSTSADEFAGVLVNPPGHAIEIFQDGATRRIIIRELPFADIETRVLRLTPEQARLVAAHLLKLAERIDAGSGG